MTIAFASNPNKRTALSQALYQFSGVIPDPYFQYTTLLLPGNGSNGANNNTFLDGSTNNFTITRNGNTTQGTFSPFSQTGWSTYLYDGLIQASMGTNGQFGTGDFTVDIWVYPLPGSQAVGNVIWSFALYPNGIFLTYNNDGTISVFSYGATRISGSAGTLMLNAWSHIAVSRAGTALRLFVNGSQIGSTYTDSSNYTQGFYGLGRPDDVASYYYRGYLSNFRVVKGTALYTANFTPSTSSLTAVTNTQLLILQSNRYRDNSTNNYAITVSGTYSIQAFSPFNPTASWSAATYGGSGYFDGSGDYLNTASNTALNLGTGDFTWEFWTYLSGTESDGNTLFQPRTPAGIDAVLFGYKSGSNYSIYATTNGSSWNLFSNTTIIAVSDVVNRWAHWAFVRNGSVYSVYVDGVSKTSATSASSISQLTNVFTFMNAIPGYMSNFRFVKGQALATGAFTPPTSPVTTSSVGWTGANVPTQAITGSVNLLLNFTNVGIYDATSKNNLETVGNAQISTTQSKWGGSSMYFDGNGDYLLFPTSNLYRFGTGPLTVEFWFYPLSSLTNAGIVDMRVSSSSYSGLLIKQGDGSSSGTVIYCWLGFPGSTTAATQTGLNINQWNYIAVVRDNSNNLTVYVNGSGGTPVARSIDLTDTNCLVGAFSNASSSPNALHGYINDLRISRIARYTANFTPPTSAFPTL